MHFRSRHALTLLLHSLAIPCALLELLQEFAPTADSWKSEPVEVKINPEAHTIELFGARRSVERIKSLIEKQSEHLASSRNETKSDTVDLDHPHMLLLRKYPDILQA